MSNRSTGTARPPMTRPRLSQLTLEGAAGLASTMLVAWLLLWFVTKIPRSTPVIALRDMGSIPDVPYLEADRREIAGAKSKPAVEDDADRAVKTPSGTAVVISIAGPGSVDSKAIVDRINKIALTARRNVLILLDQAQVDNDGELGVFGNAPYLGLASALEGMKVADPKANVFVLCSAAPGQKSWMIDGQGRSVFSYFVQLGLAGNPETEGNPARKGIDRLDDFVRRNVQGWVKLHRRDAIQTPVLLAVGKSSRFSLPSIRIALPGQSTLPADPKATVDPGKASRNALATKWQKHDELAKDEPAPYRFAPAAWRAYETALLRAERLVRSASNDPTLQDQADQALARVDAQSEGLSDSIKQAKKKESDFPIQPASADPVGRRALIDSAKSVSGQILDIAVDDPSGKASGDSPASGARKATDVAEAKPVDAPRELEEAATIGRPRKYLEIQFPAWAFRFQKAFPFNSFNDRDRALLFKEAVLKRMPAEEAIALDRRGLDWIVADIRKGDMTRREVQDSLFGPLDDESIPRLKSQIADFDRAYASASASVEQFREARSLFEKIAAKLPYLGEWAVLDADRQALASPSLDPFKLPDRLDTLLQATKNLGLAMAKPGELEALRTAREEAEAALGSVEEDYKKRYQDLNLGARWRDIDDVLVTPLIPWKERQRFVDQAVNPTIDGPAPSPNVADEAIEPLPKPPFDPSFRRRSAGLAMLDFRVRALSADEPPKPPEKTQDPKDDPAAIEAMLTSFAGYSRQIQNLRKDLQSRPEPKEDQTEAKLAARLLLADQDVRFRRAAEQSGDQASIDLEAFARYVSILFHVDRLSLDNAPKVQEFRDLASTFKLAKKLNSRPVAKVAILSLDVKPANLPIDKDSHLARFEVVLKGDLPGRAFVGSVPIASSKEATPLTVSLLDSTRKGDLAGSGSLAFRIEQTTSVSDDPTAKLAVKGFFRGQVTDDRKDVVTVDLVDFGKSVIISIARDEDQLNARYRNDSTGQPIMRNIRDQFEVHPGLGAIHRMGKLEYILSFRNTTAVDKEVLIQRTLKPYNAEGPPIPIADITQTLKPRGSTPFTLPASIGHLDLDKDMELLVRVTDPKKKEPPIEEKILFRRLALDKYITITPRRGFRALHEGEDKVECLILLITRDENDLVTEPIMYKDMEFFFNDRPVANNLDKNKYLKRGDSVEAFWKILPTDIIINYRVVIEGAEKVDKYKVQ